MPRKNRPISQKYSNEERWAVPLIPHKRPGRPDRHLVESVLGERQNRSTLIKERVTSFKPFSSRRVLPAVERLELLGPGIPFQREDVVVAVRRPHLPDLDLARHLPVPVGKHDVEDAVDEIAFDAEPAVARVLLTLL